MEFYLCRHGETAWSLTGQHTGSTDLPLLDPGKEQAIQLKKPLHHLSFDLVISSPLKRARKTAALAGFHPEIEELAREWDYGDYEGLTTAEIHQKNPSWNLFHDGAPNGESPPEVAERADRLIEKYTSRKGILLLFSHGHFLRMLAARWLRLDPKEGKGFSLSVASISHLGFEKGEPVMKRWNWTQQ